MISYNIAALQAILHVRQRTKEQVGIYRRPAQRQNRSQLTVICQKQVSAVGDGPARRVASLVSSCLRPVR